VDDPAFSARLAAEVRDLEDFAAGLHPRVLDERGLEGAVRRLASQAPVPVSVDVAAAPSSPEVQAAAYFVCAEALTNIAKYARATRASVSIEERDGALHIAVHDDGVGGADPQSGSGLAGLRDRVAALGGSFDLTSEPGGGTRLVARIPL
jgi:signal transduction histidine kinase